MIVCAFKILALYGISVGFKWKIRTFSYRIANKHSYIFILFSSDLLLLMFLHVSSHDLQYCPKRKVSSSITDFDNGHLLP